MLKQAGVHIARVWPLVVVLQVASAGILLSQTDDDPSPHSDASIITEMETARPGEPFTVGLRLVLDPGWHSYWINPGDAGQPASIEWHLPAGFRAGELHWPYPQLIDLSSAVSYGYYNEVVLLTEILPPRFVTTPQTVTLSGEMRWLVCSNICLPARADLHVRLKITENEPRPESRWQSLFAETRHRLPQEVADWEMSATQDDDTVILTIETGSHAGVPFERGRFFPSDRAVIEHGAPQIITWSNNIVRITLRKSRFLRTPIARLKGVLVLPDSVDVANGTAWAVSVDAVTTDSPVNRINPRQ